MAKENVITRARDELFSHINRCGVLQAEPDDQRHWLDETVDYLAERYPDLSDGDLQELSSVGVRFCQPAIPHGRKRFGFNTKESASVVEAKDEPKEAEVELVSLDASAEKAPQES